MGSRWETLAAFPPACVDRRSARIFDDPIYLQVKLLAALMSPEPL